MGVGTDTGTDAHTGTAVFQRCLPRDPSGWACLVSALGHAEGTGFLSPRFWHPAVPRLVLPASESQERAALFEVVC